MKSLMIVVAAACAATALPAFAQSSAAPAQQVASVGAPAAPMATASVAQPGGWVPPYGQPIHEKSRAEVYQELVHAEQDGQLAYLNKELYSH